MSDSSSSSDVEIIGEKKKSPKDNDSIPDVESGSVEDVDSLVENESDYVQSISISDHEEEKNEETPKVISISKRRVNGDKIQYFVHYSHSSQFPDEWVDEDNLLGQYDDLIVGFVKNMPTIPEKKGFDVSNLSFNIIGALKKNNKIYYKLQYENGETTMISSKKMHALDSKKLIEFLEDYCIREKKVHKL